MTDTMREAFDKWCLANLAPSENDVIEYCERAWQAAQADARAFKTRLLEALYPDGIKHPQQTEDDFIIDAVKQRGDARALVGELVDYSNHKFECGFVQEITNHCTCGRDATLTKAQAFMEGK